MNRALGLRIFRDSIGALGLVFAAVIAFEMLYVVAVNHVAEDFVQIWRRIPMLQEILEMLAGVNLEEDVSTTSLMTLGMVHPFLFAVCWAVLIAICTRNTVGELDTGTADLLLTLPISRASVFVSVSVIGLAGCFLLSLAAWIGLALGGRLFSPAAPPDLWRVFIASVNFWALLLAVSGGTMCVAAFGSRRGMAVAITLSGLLVSFLINFLAVFVPLIGHFSFLGFLHYYRPVDCVRSGAWPTGDIFVLLVGAIAFWLVGMWRFTRRDIPAV